MDPAGSDQPIRTLLDLVLLVRASESKAMVELRGTLGIYGVTEWHVRIEAPGEGLTVIVEAGPNGEPEDAIKTAAERWADAMRAYGS